MPSPKAEPFKRWLAKVGYERVQEIEDPELATKRTRAMNDLELIFNMLGEASTIEIAKNKDAKGFEENKNVAKQGGSVAGKARKDLERKSGKKISTKENYLKDSENLKFKI